MNSRIRMMEDIPNRGSKNTLKLINLWHQENLVKIPARKLETAPSNSSINIACEGEGVSRGCRESHCVGTAVNDRMERKHMGQAADDKKPVKS